MVTTSDSTPSLGLVINARTGEAVSAATPTYIFNERSVGYRMPRLGEP